jgi:hypothetical protein
MAGLPRWSVLPAAERTSVTIAAVQVEVVDVTIGLVSPIRAVRRRCD